MDNCITDKLYLIKVKSSELFIWFICKLDGFTSSYIEIFSKKRIQHNDVIEVLSVKDYLMSINNLPDAVINNTITKEQLLELYLKVNRSEILKESKKNSNKLLKLEV